MVNSIGRCVADRVSCDVDGSALGNVLITHPPRTLAGKQPPELFGGFAHERVGLQAARVDRRLRVMRDCADIRMRKMCSAGPVTDCLRPVLHHAAQRAALQAMQPMSVNLVAGGSRLLERRPAALHAGRREGVPCGTNVMTSSYAS